MSSLCALSNRFCSYPVQYNTHIPSVLEYNRLGVTMFALLLLLLLHHHTSVASIARVQDSCVATDYPHEYVAILQARIQELESELAISKRALIPTLSTTDFEALGTLFCASSMAARKFEDTTPATAVSMVWMDGRHPQHFTPWSTAAASLMPTNILQQKQIIQMVERWGVAVVKKTLTNLQAEKLSQEVLYEVLVKPTSQFMPIHTSSNRFDYPLSLEPGTYGAEAVVAMVSALRMPLEALLGGGGARLVEASTLTICPVQRSNRYTWTTMFGVQYQPISTNVGLLQYLWHWLILQRTWVVWMFG